uniref:Uncharacterized protein n=1 Tax=Anopheles culicifacies TaxID=139723 RepID=A0A182MW30_9DIPT
MPTPMMLFVSVTVCTITCPTEDGTLHTILVRSLVSLQNATVRKILPWFFSQALPLFDVLAGNCVVMRLQVKTDPFRHLRRRKSPPFDGKGFNLQRNARHAGFVCIDEWLKIPIEDFNQLCPGLFYGTVKYPNLNIVLSQRRFRQHVVNSAKVWNIMYDCLLCRQFDERQQTEGDFKREMRRKYLATQMKDFRSDIAELEERIEMTQKYSKLKNTLQQQLVHLHSLQVQQYNDEVKRLKMLLKETVHDKQQLLAIRTIYDHDETVAITGEISVASIRVRTNELENILAFCQGELIKAKANKELRTAFETFLGELKNHIDEMEVIVDQVNSIRFMDSALENVRCSIENNQSMLMLSKTNANERKIYLSNLHMNKQCLKMHMRSAQEEITRMKREKTAFIEQMQALKDFCNASTTNNDPREDDELIDLLQQTIGEIVETTNAIASYEKEIVLVQQQIWRSYVETFLNVPFAELASIAAVKLAIEMLDANAKEDFLGFVYERALEAGLRTKWCVGLSCSAIFRTMNSATRVKQVIEKEQNMKTFQYIVLESSVRTSLNTFLHTHVPEESSHTSSYKETVSNVNALVEQMVTQLRTKSKLNAASESLKHLTAAKEERLADLDVLHNGSFIKWPRIRLQELPRILTRSITLNNQEMRLRARYDALEKFIHCIKNTDPLPDAEQLKLEELRLNEQLESLLQEVTHSNKSYCEVVKQLTAKCDTIQFALQRHEEDFDLIPDGLSSTVCDKLVNCWTACSETLLHSIATLEDAVNQFIPSDVEEPATDIHELNEQIQTLNLREISLAARLTRTETMLEDYQRENNFTLDNKVCCFSQSRRTVQECNALLNKIVCTQKQLQQIPPGCCNNGGTKIASMKNKLKWLHVLEKQRTDVREMCFNNLILPIIDKLHVQKLRQVCQLVTSVSEDLPELGGIAKVIFDYEAHGPEYTERSDYLQIDDRHSWVAETTDIECRFQVKLSATLRPQPAPILLLVLVAHRLQDLQVTVAAFGITVKNVRQHGHDAQRFLLARIARNLFRGELHDFRTWNVFGVLIQRPVYDVGRCAATVVIFGPVAILRACREVFDRRETLHTVLGHLLLVNGCIECAKLNLALQLRRRPSPRCLRNILGRALSIVIDRRSFVRTEDLDGRIASYTVLSAKALLLLAVYATDLDYTLQCGGRLLVLRHQVSAMATERCVELNHPYLVAFHHGTFKVGRRQCHDIIGRRV